MIENNNSVFIAENEWKTLAISGIYKEICTGEVNTCLVVGIYSVANDSFTLGHFYSRPINCEKVFDKFFDEIENVYKKNRQKANVFIIGGTTGSHEDELSGEEYNSQKALELLEAKFLKRGYKISYVDAIKDNRHLDIKLDSKAKIKVEDPIKIYNNLIGTYRNKTNSFSPKEHSSNFLSEILSQNRLTINYSGWFRDKNSKRYMEY